MHDRGLSLPEVELTNDAEVWIGNDQPLGVIYLRDEIRPATKRVIDFLKRSGLSVALLARATDPGRLRWWQSKWVLSMCARS